MFHSTYLKLTFFYVLVVMFISIAFSGAIYRISALELGRGLGRQTRALNDLPIDKRLPVTLQELEKIRQEQIELSSSNLIEDLIYFNLLILILSSAGSYFFARRTLKPIEDMIEAQNRFTADASHELKTPLTAMKTEIEVSLRDKRFSLDKAKELFLSNLEEISKLELLSGALLKMAKYKEESEENFKQIDLSQVIVGAYEKVEGLAKDKEIKFENKLEKINTRGDEASLKELFVILLDNAIKYSPKRSKVSIDISKEGKWAIVKITDRGIGIKASDLPHIFDRFYRADNSRCKNPPVGGCDGYGLGLSIAKQIVDLHNGEISVKSTPGKGSRFLVKFHI